MPIPEARKPVQILIDVAQSCTYDLDNETVVYGEMLALALKLMTPSQVSSLFGSIRSCIEDKDHVMASIIDENTDAACKLLDELQPASNPEYSLAVPAWKKTCLDAIEEGKKLDLKFKSSDSAFAHNDGPCKLIGAIIEPNDQFDEEALPFYIIKTSSGEEVEAYGGELQCDDSAALLNLRGGICLTFGLARLTGKYLSPSDLDQRGTADEKAQFEKRIAGSYEDKLAIIFGQSNTDHHF